MHKFRTVLTVVATAGMVLGTMGAASAAGTTTSNETRAQFIQQLDESLGISPVYPATADYQDVPSTNPYYGYIEAATQKGFVNGISAGMFGPNDPITRAEAAKILVEAYGAGAQATATSTTFTDNSSIPTALVGFVAEAAKLGLMKGFTNGSFGPEAYLTSAQETHLVAQLQAALAASFKITASSTDVAVGQIVTLSSSSGGSTTYTVTGSNASSALISGSSFVASASGNYTVTGTTGGGATATVTIGVYGTVTQLSISGAGNLVANGVSTQTVTVTAEDANGNAVLDYNGNVATSLTGTDATLAAANFSEPTAFTNGVATFEVTAGTVPNVSQTFSASTTPVSTAISATATVTDTAQVATSLSVTAPKYISANLGTELSTVSVTVNDQTGNPMMLGTYGVSLSLTGPAQFLDGTSGPESVAYIGNDNPASPASANVDFTSVKGETGSITFTASSTGLSSGTGTTTSVIAGNATALTTSATAASFTEGPASASAYSDEFTVGTVDSHGYPTGAPTSIKVNVMQGSSPASTIEVSENGTAWTSVDANGNATITDANGITQFYVADTTAGADAGTYTVTVSDPNNILSSASPVSVSETAGSAYQVAFTGGASEVAITAPSTTVTAQVQDKYGNSVADAGVGIAFTVSNTAGYGYSINGTSSSSVPAGGVVVDTNSSGAASATIAVQPYAGQVFDVNVTNNANPLLVNPANNSNTIAVVNTVVASVKVGLLNPATGSQGYAMANDTVDGTVYATDSYGNGVNGDTIYVTFSSAPATYSGLTPVAGTTATYSAVTTGAGANAGEVNFTFTEQSAGTLTVTAADQSLGGSPSGSAAFSVAPLSTVSSFDVFDSSGNDQANATTPDSYTQGTPVAITLRPVDQYSNATVTSGVYYVAVPYWLGDFRTTTTGLGYDTVTVNAGSTATSLYFVPGSTNSFLIPTSALAVYESASTSTSETFAAIGSGAAGATWTWTNTTGLATLTGTTLSWASGASGSGTLEAKYTDGSGNTWYVDISVTY